MTKKLISLVGSILLVAGFATPAESAGVKYSVYQKTLATFSSTATTLTSQQKAQVRAAVEANPSAEKFICTGIRYYSQPMSVNIMVRKRAKAACEYAKQLNPELSTWFQNKPTKARSYAGKVLLTVKSPKVSEEEIYDSLSNGDTPSVVKHSYLSCDSNGVDTNVPRISQDLIMPVDCLEDAQTPTAPLPLALVETPIQRCELRDVSSERLRFDTLMVGFPRGTKNLDPLKPYKVVVLPVDWQDMPGEGKPSDVHLAAAQKFVDYYNDVSYGKMKLKLDFNDEWFRLPGLMSDYEVTEYDYQNPYSDKTKAQKTRLLHNGVSVADPKVDFTDTAIVIFVLPERQTAIELTLQGFWNGDLPSPAQSDEGLIKNFFTAGKAFPLREVWSYYAHEFGHTIMLPDYYLQIANYGNDRLVQIPVGPFSGFEMMSTQAGPSRTMSLWSRFLMGWLEDSNIYCAELSTLRDTSLVLEPIDTQSENLKGAVIRISDTEAIVIESRRETRYDEKHLRSRNGVIVYTVDTSISHGQGPLALVPPEGRGLYTPYSSGGLPQLDAMLYVGNSVEVAGLEITVNSSSDFDVVSIRKK